VAVLILLPRGDGKMPVLGFDAVSSLLFGSVEAFICEPVKGF
jgi:hypothetical protein